jgi:hypothetical protein
MTQMSPNHSLSFPDGKVVTFHSPVADSQLCGGLIVVRFAEKRPDNVAAYNSNGKEVWRATPLMTREGILWFDEIKLFGNELRMRSLDAYRVVSPQTGTVLREYWEK